MIVVVDRKDNALIKNYDVIMTCLKCIPFPQKRVETVARSCAVDEAPTADHKLNHTVFYWCE